MKRNPPRLEHLSPAEKRLLLKKLSIEKRSQAGVHPLSYGQRALWHIQRLMPESPVYNVALAWRVLSEPDIPALRKTFQWLIDRHASLRTTYTVRNGEPAQIVHPAAKLHFKIHQSLARSSVELDRELDLEAYRPFNLEKGPLLRVNLFLREPGQHLLLVNFHHIAVDLWSSTYIFDEIGLLYPKARRGRQPDPPITNLQYTDYVRWQRQMLSGPEGNKLWEFWRRQFPADISPLRLPIQVGEQTQQSFAGACHPFLIGRSLAGELRRLAKKYQTTLYNVLLAGFQALLHIYSRQDRFMIRSLTVGRSQARFENIIGFFANPVVIDADFSDAPTFSDILTRVRERVSLTIEHQDFPFELLMEKLGFGKDISYNPNPEVMFILQTPQRFVSVRKDSAQIAQKGVFSSGNTGVRLDLGGLVVEKYNPTPTVTLNELAIEMAEVGNALSGAVHYRTDLFPQRAIVDLADHFVELLDFMVENLDQGVKSFVAASPSIPASSDQGVPISIGGESAHCVLSQTPPPDGEVETELTKLVQNVLGLPAVGVRDDFFTLGGSSLQALQLITQIREVFQIGLPLRLLFEVRTVAGLAKALREEVVVPRAPSIIPVWRDEQMPLSHAQERLWFLDRLTGNHALYNVPIAVRLQGPLEAPVLEQCLATIITRHEILRTTFSVDRATPKQTIHPHLEFRLRTSDLTHLPQEKRWNEARQLAEAEGSMPFELDRGPLIRAFLIRIGKEDHIAVVTLHHIVADGWSYGVLFRELCSLYLPLKDGKRHPLPKLQVQYADYAHWQRQWLRGAALDQRLAYWRTKLENLQPLNLPTDRPHGSVQTYRGSSVSFQIPNGTGRALSQLAAETGATPFMVLLTAFMALLHRYTQEDDIAVGSPMASRDRAEVQDLIGCFVNVVVHRTDLSGDPTFVELLERVRDTVLGALANQDLPFEKLVEALNTERDLSRNPVFQVMFAMQQLSLPPLSIQGGPVVEVLDFDRGVARYDLTLFVTEVDQGLQGQMEYNSDLFDKATIERMVRHFLTLVEGATTDPTTNLSALPLMSHAERRQLLADNNATTMVYPEVTFAELFEAQADQAPERVAFVDGPHWMTYRELDRLSNRRANSLGSRGIGPGTRVAVLLELSSELIVSLLGVLKTGAAVVILDPDQPEPRQRHILQDAQPELLLIRHEQAEKFSFSVRGASLLDPEQIVRIDDDTHFLQSSNFHRPNVEIETKSPAYVLYTSGTTGTPKGVEISHRALANYLQWCRDTYRIEEGNGVPLHSSPAFDFTFTSLFAPLICGQRVVNVGSTTEGRLLAGLNHPEEDWSLLKLTPQHARALGEQRARNPAGRIRTLVLGGEKVKPEHLAAWRQVVQSPVIFNEYGPTETTVGCCAYRLSGDREELPCVPIGRPIANTRVYILDRYLKPMPLGIPGELYVGGAGVAERYVGRKTLTAERFIPDPFVREEGARLFRTGDRARWLSSGNIEYLSRIDSQAKVRGYRIEPAEIESALADHSEVERALVVAREDHHQETVLVAYYVPSGAHPVESSALRRFLQSRLPGVMVPSAFVPVKDFPLSRSGKIESKALPLPEDDARAQNRSFKDEIDKEMASLWTKVLGVKDINVLDDFFSLGGHSLRALQLIELIRTELNVELPLSAVFETPSLAGMASRVRVSTHEADTRREQTPGATCVTLRSGTSLPLFFLHPAGGGFSVYSDLIAEIEAGYTICGLQSRAMDNSADEHGSLQDMSIEYGRIIQEREPVGPYHLVGWSLGGVLAHTVADALERDGREVAFVGLLDPRFSVQPSDFNDSELLAHLEALGIDDGPVLREVLGRRDYVSSSAWLDGALVELESLSRTSSDAGLRLLLERLRLVRIHKELLDGHHPPKIIAPVHIWQASETTGNDDSVVQELSKTRVLAQDAPEGHFAMLRSAKARKLATSLNVVLASLLTGRRNTTLG